MFDQWYIVIYADTGEAYSIGTQIADPMPSQFIAVRLSNDQATALINDQAVWDAKTRTILQSKE